MIQTSKEAVDVAMHILWYHTTVQGQPITRDDISEAVKAFYDDATVDPILDGIAMTAQYIVDHPVYWFNNR